MEKEIKLFELITPERFEEVYVTMRELAAHYEHMIGIALELLDQDRAIVYEHVQNHDGRSQGDKYEIQRYMWDTFEVKRNGTIIGDMSAFEVLTMLYKQVPFIPTIRSLD
jgi:hypothetical protein